MNFSCLYLKKKACNCFIPPLCSVTAKCGITAFSPDSGLNSPTWVSRSKTVAQPVSFKHRRINRRCTLELKPFNDFQGSRRTLVFLLQQTGSRCKDNLMIPTSTVSRLGPHLPHSVVRDGEK